MQTEAGTKTLAPELVGTWDIDPAHSTVEAVARYAMLTSVRGRFASFNGTITVGETLEQSGVEVEIDASSIDTRNETRDGHLKSEDFLHVEEHPTIPVRSKRVEQVDKDSFKVWGDLTLRGVTKEVELDVDFEGVGPDPWGNTRAGIVAVTTINRKDWGVNWNAVIETGGVLVGDKLKIELNISAIKRKEESKDAEQDVVVVAEAEATN
jgi:polyisoprenoid-binding protein YceI